MVGKASKGFERVVPAFLYAILGSHADGERGKAHSYKSIHDGYSSCSIRLRSQSGHVCHVRHVLHGLHKTDFFLCSQRVEIV